MNLNKTNRCEDRLPGKQENAQAKIKKSGNEDCLDASDIVERCVRTEAG